MSRRSLFDAIEPYEIGTIDLDDRHVMYWEQSGNPTGVPILFLHGGPGAGASELHRRFFDPAHYRIIIFDQRGAGRSTPLGEVTDNTTQHLIADIETLRSRLGIEAWILFGGSWGSSLALAYGQANPGRCLGLIMRGIFLGRRRELDWFLDGVRRVFPEPWRAFREFLPAAERDDLLGNYHRRLVDPDPEVHLPAARAWSAYEGACSTLLPSPETVAAFRNDRVALGLARIEAHYFVNDCFIDDDALLDDIDRLADVPAVIVQGRYDMVCPIATADELARAWPGAEYIVVPNAGHSALEEGLRTELLAATERFKSLS